MHLNDWITFTGQKAGEQPESDGDLFTETVNGRINSLSGCEAFTGCRDVILTGLQPIYAKMPNVIAV